MSKKILQLCPALDSGGIEQGTVDMAIAAKQAGFESIVVSNGGKLVKRLEEAGIKHEELPLQLKSPLKIYLNAFDLANYMMEKQIDLVHARSRAPIWAAVMATRKHKVPLITGCHSPHRNGFFGFKKLYNSGITHGDKIIAISSFIADYLKKEFKVKDEKINIIHRGIDVEQFHPTKIDEQKLKVLKQQWQIPDNKTIVMLPGRITRWKGQQVLLEALTQLSDLDIFVVLVGRSDSDSYSQELEHFIEKNNLQDKVKITGNCDDMPCAYALSDIVVSASIKPEAFGRVAVEAQAMQKPLIATNIGATQETVIDKKTGLLSPPKDPQALAKAIRQLHSQPDSLSINNSRGNVIQLFSKETMCNSTLQLYQSLL